MQIIIVAYLIGSAVGYLVVFSVQIIWFLTKLVLSGLVWVVKSSVTAFKRPLK
jgi:hypothetical protein